MTVEGLGAVLTAIVTPFDDDLNVDEEAFVDLMHHLAAHGSDGFVVCGTTGEASTLTDEEHLRVIELAVQERPSGATIIAGTGSNNTRHAVHLTERATELGVDAVLSVTPYYNRPNRRGILAHFGEVARATDKPVVLYNVPSRVVIDLPNDLLAELAQLDNVAYIKQANNANLAQVDGLGLYAGNDDAFLDTLELGGCGGILVASHLVGEQMRRMVDEPEQPGRDRRLAAGRVRGDGHHHQPHPGEGGSRARRSPRRRPAASPRRGLRRGAHAAPRRCSSVTDCSPPADPGQRTGPAAIRPAGPSPSPCPLASSSTSLSR